MIFDLCECLKGAVKDRRFSIPREAVGQDLNQETLESTQISDKRWSYLCKGSMCELSMYCKYMVAWVIELSHARYPL
jgi:hypothetical protein